MSELKPCPFPPNEIADILETFIPEIEDCMVVYEYQRSALHGAVAALRRAQPSNEPLTLDELRGMDGEPQPVYLVSDKYAEGNGWKVCHGVTNNGLIDLGDEVWSVQVFADGHVIAYRRKPERSDEK